MINLIYQTQQTYNMTLHNAATTSYHQSHMSKPALILCKWRFLIFFHVSQVCAQILSFAVYESALLLHFSWLGIMRIYYILHHKLIPQLCEPWLQSIIPTLGTFVSCFIRFLSHKVKLQMKRKKIFSHRSYGSNFKLKTSIFPVSDALIKYNQRPYQQTTVKKIDQGTPSAKVFTGVSCHRHKCTTSNLVLSQKKKRKKKVISGTWRPPCR